MSSLVEETSNPSKYFSPKAIHISRTGRPKGAKNIVGQSVRWNLLEAYRLNGGLEWLTGWAKENPSEFFPLMAKLLPAELAESGAGQAIRVLVYAPNSNESAPTIDQIVDATSQPIDSIDGSTPK